MAQVTSGLRALLSHPAVYDALQTLMRGHVARQDFARHMIRAAPGMRVLDIGCGTGDLLAFLPAPLDYIGFDVSAKYLAAAERRFGSRARFVLGPFDAPAAATVGPIDVAIASGLLHHLDDAAASGLMRLVRSVLAPGGRFVSIDPVFVPGQHPLARALIRRDRGQNVREPEGYAALARSAFADVQGVVRHRSWVPYTHWMMACGTETAPTPTP